MSGVPDLPHEEDFDLADDIFELPEGYDDAIHFADEAYDITGMALCGYETPMATDRTDLVTCPSCALFLVLEGKLPG